jgi:hypothetical protein
MILPVAKKASAEIHEKMIPAIQAHIEKRGKDYKHAEDNHVTRDLFSQSHVLDKWCSSMPTAEALYPLQKPHLKVLADGTPFDEAAELFFPHALDGVGLRSRAAIMSYVMYHYFADHLTTKNKPLKWASLACGAAIPVFDEAKLLIEDGQHLELFLADLDPKALRYAKRLAQTEYDIHERITIQKSNILRLKKLQ